jgi:DNA-binding MarR family transcriptional regulator
VPHKFLRQYSKLRPAPLTSNEALFVLHLMSFKWSEAAPFPTYRRIAGYMGVSDKMVRRYAQSLQRKGYLRRQFRTMSTNMFDLTDLFNALPE